MLSLAEEEWASLPTSLTTLVTRDADAPPNAGVAYTMLDGDRDAFSVDAESGVVALRRALDRETLDQYTMVIRATDTGEYALRRLGDALDGSCVPSLPLAEQSVQKLYRRQLVAHFVSFCIPLITLDS